MKRTIIDWTPAGNTGIHQFGFRRFAEITGDCGHRTSVTYHREGDRPDGCYVHDSTPEVGDQFTCPKCGRESLRSSSPKDYVAAVLDGEEYGFAVKAFMDGPACTMGRGEADELQAFWPA